MVVILVTLCKIYRKWEGPVWVLTFGYWVAIMQRTRINGGSEKMTKSVSEKKGVKETRISRIMTEFEEQRRWMSIVSVTSVVEWILFYFHSFHSWSQILLWFLPFHLYARTSWMFFSRYDGEKKRADGDLEVVIVERWKTTLVKLHVKKLSMKWCDLP